jgi:4-hydroxybenzoyl-CoA thioesterase
MATNTYKARIEWGDCDPAGIIFYPQYFRIFDGATSALFERVLAMNKIDFLKAYDFAGFPLINTDARFIKPTRFGDDVVVESTIAFGTSSFEVKHLVKKDGELMAEGQEKRVWVVRDLNDPSRLKSHPIPQAVIAKFKA